MKLSTESLLRAKTLICFGLRPQQIKTLTGVNESRISGLTKEIIANGRTISTKGSLSANKILRTKNHYRQFSLWMIIYKMLLDAEFDYFRSETAKDWYKNLDCNLLIKTQAIFINLMESEFAIGGDSEDVIDASECFSILTEINTKETTYIVSCPDCDIEYVVVESSKQTDNCPFCHERGYETEKHRIESIFDNLINA